MERVEGISREAPEPRAWLGPQIELFDLDNDLDRAEPLPLPPPAFMLPALNYSPKFSCSDPQHPAFSVWIWGPGNGAQDVPSHLGSLKKITPDTIVILHYL